jgi:hypothetical protein
LNSDELKSKAKEHGVLRVFEEDKDKIVQRLKEMDPEQWELFVESQEMARKNVQVGSRTDVRTSEGAMMESAVGPGEVAVQD